MMDLTFGEQVKIILSRKGMTIKELAELVEKRTGKPMSRQNMTQRLGRDNFQEQDMRLIAEILGCKFQLSIMEMDEGVNDERVQENKTPEKVVQENGTPLEREITVGELIDMADAVVGKEEAKEVAVSQTVVEKATVDKEKESEERKMLRKGIGGYFRRVQPSAKETTRQAVSRPEKGAEKTEIVGDINPYTGKEYKSNSVRMHPKRIGYVQVYDQSQHKWTDMTEWAFLGYQERKKALLGKDYDPPIYLD